MPPVSMRLPAKMKKGMAASGNLLIELNGAVARVTENRPDKLNALNRATLTELQSAFDALRADPQVRVIVLTGAGPNRGLWTALRQELANLIIVRQKH